VQYDENIGNIVNICPGTIKEKYESRVKQSEIYLIPEHWLLPMEKRQVQNDHEHNL